MKIEDVLSEAMRRHVADVQSPPALGTSVRRRSRSHRLRVRTAGAALLTVAVAGGIPLYQAVTTPPTANPTAAGPARAVVIDKIKIPDVVSMKLHEAEQKLKDAGLAAEVTSTESGILVVKGQNPAAGTLADLGAKVQLEVKGENPNLLNITEQRPRTFAGIKLDHLPEDLVWTGISQRQDDIKIDEKAGVLSFLSYRQQTQEEGYYALRVDVWEGAIAEDVERKLAKAETAETADGRKLYLAAVSEGGDLGAVGSDIGPEGGANKVGVKLKDGLFVELTTSPDYSDHIGGPEKLTAELRKFAEGVKLAEQ
ncbi:PASTA domain-containing protein [Nonomuraea longicatena]|uniref:PASTA domain-containing protein n=1 Tax=Nonomuraea longicatena TaxID=83682 RepID=A0ABP4B9R9_9ACTN